MGWYSDRRHPRVHVAGRQTCAGPVLFTLVDQVRARRSAPTYHRQGTRRGRCAARAQARVSSTFSPSVYPARSVIGSLERRERCCSGARVLARRVLSARRRPGRSPPRHGTCQRKARSSGVSQGFLVLAGAASRTSISSVAQCRLRQVAQQRCHWCQVGRPCRVVEQQRRCGTRPAAALRTQAVRRL